MPPLRDNMIYISHPEEPSDKNPIEQPIGPSVMESTDDQEKPIMLREAENNNLYYVHSPLQVNEHTIVIYQRTGITGPPNNFCIVYDRKKKYANKKVNFFSPSKRSFLNECIRHLYVVNGLSDRIHWAPNSIVWSREELRSQVEVCIRPAHMTLRMELLQRLKRQLFREPQGSRKQPHPRRHKVWGIQVIFFRPIRKQIGPCHVRRSYQRNARRTVIEQMIRENIKREYLPKPIISTESCLKYATQVMRIGYDADGIFNVNANLLNEIYAYHGNRARHHPLIERKLSAAEKRERYLAGTVLITRAKHLETMFIHEQMRRALQTHQLIAEEAARSSYYGKELFRLIQDHEKYIHNDKLILRR